MAEKVEIVVKLTDQVSPGAKKIRNEIDGISKSAGGIKDLVKQFVALGVVIKAASFAKESALLAARVETLGVVTKKLGENVGMSEQKIRSLERAITDQGITLQKSRQSIAMMIQANVDLAHATDLARMSQDTAVIANLNSSEAFQRMVYVLQTGNVRMARTLGLNVQFGKAYKDLAKELGKTTDELTEQEIMMARTNEVMKAGARISGTYEAAMETAGKKVLSMDRQIEELTRSFGEALMPILEITVSALYDLTSGLNAVSQALKDHRQEMTYGEHTYEEYRDEMVRLGGQVGRWNSDVVALTEVQWNLTRALEVGRGTIDGWAAGVLGAGTLVGNTEKAVEALTSAQYFEAAAEAFIAGDNKAALHYWTMGEDARIAKGKIDALVRAMEAAAAMEGMTMGGWSAWSEIPEGDLPDVPSAPSVTSGGGGGWSSGVQERAGGGPLSKRGWTLVGDPGPYEELVSPGGWVFDAKTTKKLMEGGLVPDAKRGTGGYTDGIKGGKLAPTTATDNWKVAGGGTIIEDISSGGGSAAVVAAAVSDIAAVTQAVPAETAELVAAAIAPTVTQQTQQLLTSQKRAAEADIRQESLLGQILSVLQGQGTADDMGDSMSESMQFYDD